MPQLKQQRCKRAKSSSMDESKSPEPMGSGSSVCIWRLLCSVCGDSVCPGEEGIDEDMLRVCGALPAVCSDKHSHMARFRLFTEEPPSAIMVKLMDTGAWEVVDLLRYTDGEEAALAKPRPVPFEPCCVLR